MAESEAFEESVSEHQCQSCFIVNVESLHAKINPSPRGGVSHFGLFFAVYSLRPAS